MSNPNDAMFDDQVRRRIALERYSDKQAREALKYLQQVKRDITARMATGEFETYTARQQRLLLESVGRLMDDIYAKLGKDLQKGFENTAKEQAKFEAGSIRNAVGGTIRELSATQAIEVAMSRPLSGRFLKDMLSDLPVAHKRRVEAALRLSFTEGESLWRASRRIGSELSISQRGLRTLIRTANSHMASAVSDATWKANSDIMEEYEWRSILDSRTTPVCQQRDGQRYEVGKGPLPPAHMACRSTTSPIRKGYPPPARVTYDDWLRRQPASVQDDIMGPTRAKQYRAGEVSVASFVDSTSGRYKKLKAG